MLPGGIYFALESVAWTGGMAFYDRDLPGLAAARAYLLTLDQFADIAAQEMYRAPPGVGEETLFEAISAGRIMLGDGRYETLVCPATLDDIPVLTFTAPWRSVDVSLNRPSRRYIAMIASGLHESHGWDSGQVTNYLSGRPGISGVWDVADLGLAVRESLEGHERETFRA
jgi:hypothetical protein